MKAKKVWFENDFIFVLTDENLTGKMPLSWFPKLEKASEIDRNDFELWADGEWIHWEKIGEDLGVEGFFTFNKTTVEIVDIKPLQ